MLYLNVNTDEIRMCVSAMKPNATSYTLKLVNNLSNVEYVLDNLTDVSVSPLYYRFINLNSKILSLNFITGDYTFYLSSNGTPLEIGLARFGDYINTNIQYNNNEKSKIVYNG